MDHSLVYLNGTTGYDLQDHPKRMDSGGEFWKEMIRQRGEWKKKTLQYKIVYYKMDMMESSDKMWSIEEENGQTTSVFLPWEPHEQ